MLWHSKILDDLVPMQVLLDGKDYSRIVKAYHRFAGQFVSVRQSSDNEVYVIDWKKYLTVNSDFKGFLKMKEIVAPNPVDWFDKNFKIFLAGSIELGKAENWQNELYQKFYDSEFYDKQNIFYDVTLINPRRNSWSAEFGYTSECEEFAKQVNWELEAMENSDLIIMYLQPESMSPVSLMEFGLYCGSLESKMIVCCPDGFWRKGNIEIMCKRYSIPLYNSKEDLINAVKEILKERN